MGDLFNSLLKEEQVENKPKKEKKNVVKNIIGNNDKDKQISAKVNSTVYATFTKINKANGISNNSAINMLINQHIRENKYLIEED